jgi:hypothetical protein
VRYNTNKAALSLQGIIHLIDEGYAITLDDLIVFPDAQAAQDPVLWAHELTHVLQYENMGVESFANVYTLTLGQNLEAQARDWENRVAQALQSGQAQYASAGAYVSVQSGAFQAPIAPRQWQLAARQFVPPSDCGRWQGFPGGATVANICPIPIIVTSFGIATPFGPQAIQCTFNCVVLPNSNMPFYGAQGPVVGFTFVFPPM